MKLSRAVEWVRVSSDGQEEAGTPQAQHHALDRLREQRPAEVVERIDLGKGISGALPLAERPDVARVQALIEAGGVDELRVVALDRITRADSLDDRLHVLLLCARHGVVIVEANGKVIDPNEDLGTVEFVMRSAWAKQERHRIRERTVSGRQRAAREGRWAGGTVPFGFRLDPEKHVQVDEEAAQLIRRIFAMVAGGENCSRVAEHLNAEGIDSPKGRQWVPRRVVDLIRRKAYLGTIEQSQGGETFSTAVPAIIDEATWRAANRFVDGRKRWSGRPGEVGGKTAALLRGVLRCGICGGTTYVAHGQYLCRSRHSPRLFGPPCGLPRFDVGPIDAKVWADLVEMVSDPAVLNAALSPQKVPDVGSWEAQVAKCESELERLAGLQDGWLRMSRRGLLDMDGLERNLRSIVADRETLKRTAEVAREAIAAEQDAARVAADISALLPALAEKMGHAKGEDRRAVVELLVPRLPGYAVLLQPDGSFEIAGAFPVPVAPAKVGARSCDHADFGQPPSEGAQLLPFRRVGGRT